MTRTFELIEKIVNDMDLTIKVNEVVGNVLFVCNTLNIRDQSIIKDDLGNEFVVTEFEFNKSITIQPLGVYVWSGLVIDAPKPTFLQGKWISANNEYLEMSRNTSDKTPLIWLVRGYSEVNGGKMSSVKLEVEPMIYFLDQADFSTWLNEDHDKQAVNPMYNLALRFVETIEKMPTIKSLESYVITDEPRFGVQVSGQVNTKNKGNTKRILSDDLSGVGLRVPIKFFGSCINC